MCWTKQRRSRSKQDKNKEQKKEGKEVQKPIKNGPGQDNMADVFPEKVPWMTGTPHAHLATTEMAAPIPSEPSLPPNPVLPAPPLQPKGSPTAMTSAEQTVLSHLRGLAEAGMKFSDEMNEQFQLLLTKEKGAMASKSLTHTHLHKLNRLRSQVSNAEHKIAHLDGEWKAFVEAVLRKLHIHGQCYQGHRADLLENYNRRLAELAQAKQEVTAASLLLTDQPLHENKVEDIPDMNHDFQRFQEALAQAGAVDQLEQMSDVAPEDSAELIQASPTGSGTHSPVIKPAKASTYRQPTVAAFGKSHASPNRVVQHQLKHVQAAQVKEAREAKAKKDDKTAEDL